MTQLVTAISQYHPPFPQEIAGCSSEELSRLQSLVKRPLPACYVDFLVTMGRSMGGLSLYSADFRTENLIQFYLREGAPALSEGALTIGIACYESPGEDREPIDGTFELDFQDERNPLLVAFPPGDQPPEFPDAIGILDLLDPVLYEALFAKAFFKYRWSHFTHQQALFCKADSVEEVAQVAAGLQRLQLRQHPESNVVRYFESRDVTLVLSPNPGEPLRLSLASHDSNALHRLIDTLSAELSLVLPGVLLAHTSAPKPR
jgi:hypothetical protein